MNYEKKQNAMHCNLMIKNHLKIEDSKRKKEKCDYLNIDEKEKSRNYKKKQKKAMLDNLDDEQKNI